MLSVESGRSRRLRAPGPAVAREDVTAVTDALAEAVPPREFEDALDQLPDAYGTVL